MYGRRCSIQLLASVTRKLQTNRVQAYTRDEEATIIKRRVEVTKQ
jgi:hypothetical protein